MNVAVVSFYFISANPKLQYYIRHKFRNMKVQPIQVNTFKPVEGYLRIKLAVQLSSLQTILKTIISTIELTC